jgi:acyl-coenzyme A synthetase/AMP-(fatty) acid ligase
MEPFELRGRKVDFSSQLLQALHRMPEETIMDFAGQFFSRGEIAGFAEQIIALLDESGVPQDAAIGLVMRSRPLHIAAVLGLVCFRRPLTSIYAFQSPALLARDILETRFAAVILDDEDVSNEAQEALQRVGAVGICLNVARGPSVLAPELRRFQGNADYYRIKGEPSLELLSSGTTGKPKRIRFPFRMLVRSVETVKAGLTEGEIPPDICTWSFAGIAMGNIIANIMIGRYMALIDRFNVPVWVEAVQRLRPSYVSGPPAVAQMVVDADVAAEDLSSIQYFYGGSAPIPLAVQDALFRKYGIVVIWAYGATEFCGTVVSWSFDLYKQFGPLKRGATGKPLPGIQIRVVDTNSGSPLPVGEEGYLEAIVPQVGEHWIRTTDLAVIDEDGFVYHRGRGDGAILRGGFKILPETIAQALVRHPTVLEASVIGLADSRLGQVPVAAVQLRSGSPPVSEQELCDFLRDEVPAIYIPRAIRVVEQLPRTASMKIDLTAVRALFSDETHPRDTAKSCQT